MMHKPMTKSEVWEAVGFEHIGRDGGDVAQGDIGREKNSVNRKRDAGKCGQ